MYGDKAMKLPERTNEMAGVYANQCVELAKEMGLRSVNLWSKMQETEGWEVKYLRCVVPILSLLLLGISYHTYKTLIFLDRSSSINTF